MVRRRVRESRLKLDGSLEQNGTRTGLTQKIPSCGLRSNIGETTRISGGNQKGAQEYHVIEGNIVFEIPRRKRAIQEKVEGQEILKNKQTTLEGSLKNLK